MITDREKRLMLLCWVIIVTIILSPLVYKQVALHYAARSVKFDRLAWHGQKAISGEFVSVKPHIQKGYPADTHRGIQRRSLVISDSILMARRSMLSDLVRNHLKEGMYRSQILQLLGPPENSQDEEQPTSSLTYHFTYETKGSPTDPYYFYYLFITFDKNDTVRKFEIAGGGD